MTQPIRVAIVADSHFDSSSRFDECIRVHDWIAGDIQKRGVNLLLHAGDVFERKSNPLERNAVAAWLTKVANYCPVVIVRGNHDVVGDLEIFGRLETENEIQVVEGAEVVRVPDGLGPNNRTINVANIAWPRKAELLARVGVEGDHEHTQEVAQTMLCSVIRGLGAQMAGFDGPKLINMHAMVDGSVTSTGQPLVGCDMNIGLADLGLCGADFYALGHIHKGQDWKINGAPCVYPGSPRRTAFGEIEEKGYILVEFVQSREVATDGVTIRDPWWKPTWQRIPTPCAPMLLFEADYFEPADGLTHEFTIRPEFPDPIPAGAEIRFRYRVQADKREAAKHTAQSLATVWVSDGAADVKVEEVVITTTRARAPEIQQALTITDKLPILWKSRNNVPDTERQSALLSKLEELETAARNAGVAAASGKRGAIRLQSISGKGFIPYPELFSVDFDKLGQVTAIVGGNGCGKSTMVELIGGSLVPLNARFLTTPTRGPVKDITVARDAFFEVRFNRGGGEYVVRHNIDGYNGKVASSVTLDGKALLEKAQVSEFLNWASDNLPPPSVFYNTILRPQKTPGLVGMSASDRKALILRVLDLEHVEDLASRAGSRQQQSMRSVDTVRGQLTELGASDEGTTALDTALQIAIEKLEGATQDLYAAEADLGLLKRDSEVVAKAINAWQAAFRERATLAAERAKIEQRQRDVAERIKNNNTLLANEDEITAAVKESDEASAQSQEKRKEIADLDKANAVLEGEFAVLRHKEDALTTLLHASRSAVDAAEKILADRKKIEQAALDLQQWETSLTEAEGKRDTARAKLDAALGQSQVTADGRVEYLRSGLRFIAEGETDTPQDFAAGALESDDAEALKITERPAKIEALRRDLAGYEAEVKRYATNIGAVRAQAALLTKVEESARIIAEEDKRLLTIESERAALQKEMDQVGRRASINKNGAAQLRAAIDVLTLRLVELDPLVKRVDTLAQARTRLSELERQQQDFAGEMETVILQLAEMDDLGEEPKPVDTTIAQATVTIAQNRCAQLDTEVKLAERALADAQAKEARRQELAAQVTQYEANVTDWTRLAMDLGKDGIQALEISAAGPLITECANDLLRACGDTLFSVSVETSKMDAKGKREIEGCPIWVYRSDKGTIQEANTLSGGEEVFVGEALSLALMMVGCQRSGVTAPVVIRDETGAALDPARGPQYLGMLRRSAELLDAKVVFVSHAPELQGLADTAIRISDGKVVVE